jgi:N-acyl-D-aspartate/D-glutamate deacylase
MGSDIVEAFSPEAKAYEGHLIADIAREEGRDPFDVLLDIVCADDLQTTFTRVPSFPTAEDWRLAAELWREGHAMIGASDAGAHLDFTAYFDYPVYVLEHGVRHHGVLSLEEAVHLMTDVPAQLYGVRDRGRLTEGSWADIVLFDEATIATGRMHTRFDLPAGAGRLYAEPIGIHRVLVNGATVVRDGELTEARPGQLLRSGRDTRTPDLAI